VTRSTPDSAESSTCCSETNHTNKTQNQLINSAMSKILCKPDMSVCLCLKIPVASTWDLPVPSVVNCLFQVFTIACLEAVIFCRWTNQQSRFHCRMICRIQLLTPNIYGRTCKQSRDAASTKGTSTSTSTSTSTRPSSTSTSTSTSTRPSSTSTSTSTSTQVTSTSTSTSTSKQYSSTTRVQVQVPSTTSLANTDSPDITER